MLVHPVLLSCSQTRVRKMMGNRLGSTWAWFSNKNRALWSNSDNSWPYTNPFVLCLLLCLFFKVFFHKFGWVSNQLGSSTRQRKMKFKSKRLLGCGDVNYLIAAQQVSWAFFYIEEMKASLVFHLLLASSSFAASFILFLILSSLCCFCCSRFLA